MRGIINLVGIVLAVAGGVWLGDVVIKAGKAYTALEYQLQQPQQPVKRWRI